jgi:2-polyprenyl-3-methyl-5-hydroxy-6-metoxy-1,4-benzoquinol methylase
MSNVFESFWYDHLFWRFLGVPTAPFLMKFRVIQSLVRDARPSSLLDAGCGNGQYGMLLAQQCPSLERVDGFDLSEQNIAYALRLSQKLRPGVTTRFWRGALESQTLAEAYDLVIYIDCIQYVKDPKHLLSEIALHLEEKGRLILSSPVSDGIRVGIPGFIRRRHPVWDNVSRTRQELLDLISQAGLLVEQSVWVGKRWYRTYKAFDYWLRSYSKPLSYLFAPIGLLVGWVDRFVPGVGSGVFMVARRPVG